MADPRDGRILLRWVAYAHQYGREAESRKHEEHLQGRTPAQSHGAAVLSAQHRMAGEVPKTEDPGQLVVGCYCQKDFGPAVPEKRLTSGWWNSSRPEVPDHRSRLSLIGDFGRWPRWRRGSEDRQTSPAGLTACGNPMSHRPAPRAT